MLRGSVLTGAVRTATGRPAPNQQVQAIMVQSTGGERRAVNLEGGLGSVVTDDRGVYPHIRSRARRLHRPRARRPRFGCGRTAADDGRGAEVGGLGRGGRSDDRARDRLARGADGGCIRGVRTRLLSRHGRRERRRRDFAPAERRTRGRGLRAAARAHSASHRPRRRCRRTAAGTACSVTLRPTRNRRHSICFPRSSTRRRGPALTARSRFEA